MRLGVEKRLEPAPGAAESEPASEGPAPERVGDALARAGALQVRRLGQEDARAEPAAPAPLRQHDRRNEAYAASSLDGLAAPLAAGPAPAFTEEPPERAASLLAQARQGRQEALGTLGIPAVPRPEDRVLPEDGSVLAEALHVGIEPRLPGDVVMLRQLLQIGLVEGFRVVAHVSRGGAAQVVAQLPPELRGHLQLVTQHVRRGGERPWLEDYGELTAGGGVRVPAQVGEVNLIVNAMQAGRAERMCPPSERVCKATDFELQGAVENDRGQEVLATLAASGGRPLKQDLTYGEGGNRLVGTLPNGEGYALVGRDTLAISRALLTRDLGRPVTDEELIEATARDLGIRAENVIPVEQPNDFHLDMAIMLLRGGVAVLNDALAAAELTIGWLGADGQLPPGRDEAIRLHAAQTAALEARAAADMQAKGIQVHRVAGVFPDMKPPMNFLNVEAGSARAGRQFLMALGGDPRAERYILEQLSRVPGGPERIYFLDPAITGPLLQTMGGLNCRVKIEGQVAPAAPMATAARP